METIYDHPSLVRSHVTTVDGYSTHHLECGPGDGQPVVLIHGAHWDFGLGADRWFPTIVPLARAFRVIAPDQIGGGASDAPRDLSRIGNLQDRALHMLHFVEALGAGPVHLVGQSQGAWIAAYIALRQPDLVSHLVLVDSSSLAMPSGLSAKGLAPRFEASVIPGTMVNRKINEGIDVAEGVQEWIGANTASPDLLPRPYVDACVRLAERWADVWREPWLAAWDDPASHHSQYLVDGEHPGHQADRLPPSLLIWRKHPTPILEAGVELYKRMSEGSELLVVDKADHFIWQDRPEVFNEAVVSYLARHG